MPDASPYSGHPLPKSLLEEVEEEFGRPLSGTEMERLCRLAETYSEQTILHALDEASAYEKRSLPYIEALLSAWKSKGLSDEDIENGKR